MIMKKIDDSELEEIKQLNGSIESLVVQIGRLEYDKISIEFQYQDTKNKILELKKRESKILEKLSKKYGDVVINPGTGEISEMQKFK
jgi:DNA-binding response OmpR family regulator